jgi:hypothetical protein
MIHSESIGGVSDRVRKSKELNNIIKELVAAECAGCLKGKMKRRGMKGKIEYEVSAIMDMIVADMMGPINVDSFGGSRYILHIIDIHSRMQWALLAERKDELAQMFIAFIKQKQTEIGRKVKVVHYDGGTEIVNESVAAYLRGNGTKLTTTEAYTPQHNAIPERAHQTLMNGVRTALYHANATIMLWGEAVMATIHTLAKITTSSTGSVTPWEAWKKTKPSIDNLHVFGSDAYYHIHKEKRDNKISERAKKAIFIGYDSDNETYYRLLDVDAMKIIVTGDVRIFDNSFAEMKRLKEELRRGEEGNRGSEIDENDYLDDLLLLNDEWIANAFKQTEQHPNKNDKIQHADNENENEDENEEDSDSGSSSVCEKNHSPKERVEVDTLTKARVTTRRDDENEGENKNEDKSDNEDDEDEKEEEEQKKEEREKKAKKKKHISQQHQHTRTSTRVTAKPYHFDPSTYHADIDDSWLPFALSVTDGEPTTYTQAITSADCERWIQAMNDELASQEKNKTWAIVKKTSDMNVIGCRWVYKIKKDMFGNTQRYKARLVAKGYNQRYGVDYDLTHAPVLRYNSLRVILALSATTNRRLYQLDIKTAFLNADVKEDIYMEVPEGVNVDGTVYVCKLLKALYGIKQAPHVWNENINAYLITLGYTPCEKDPCIYYKKSRNGHNIIIGLFVDDILISCTTDDNDEWNEDKKKLSSQYELNDMGEAHYLLGMKIEKHENKIQLHQSKYVKNKLQQFRMEECSEQTTPETTTTLRANDGSKQEKEEPLYRAIVGSLIYIQTSTRPDITHAVNMVTRYMRQPTVTHMTAAKRILRYLKGTTNCGLVYEMNSSNNSSVTITGYCDADWGGDQDDRRSTTGYCIFINNNLVSWNTHKQATVALSSAEAELNAIVDATKEVMWLVQLLTEMHVNVTTPVILHVDNQSAMKMSTHTAEYDRSKHIQIRSSFVRENINSNTIKLEWIPTQLQLADIFTKSLTGSVFINQRDRLVYMINNETNSIHNALSHDHNPKTNRNQRT